VRLHTFDPMRYALTRGKRAGTATNYLRFYLPELLPRVAKVVWIDADGLVFGDVGQLAERALVGEHARSPIAAVLRPQKMITAATGLLAAQLQLLGLSGVSPSAPVFNAGLLVLGLAQWREEHVTLQVVINPRFPSPSHLTLLHNPWSWSYRRTSLSNEHNPLLRAFATPQLESLVDRLSLRNFKGFPGMSTEVDSQTPLVLLFHNMTTATRPTIQALSADWNVEGLGWKGAGRHARFKVRPADLCAGRYLHWSGKHKPWDASGTGAYAKLWLEYVAPLSACLRRR
jgi:hypothetical protein